VALEHERASELLGVYALDACEDGESADVEAHMATCNPCTAEAARLKDLAGWLGASEAASPSAELRSRVLAETRNRDDD
jgi:hypothetical protein